MPRRALHSPAKATSAVADLRTDLGLARNEESNQSLTGAQAAMGTPGYMAPEQAMDAKTADKRSDVFSMGATMVQWFLYALVVSLFAGYIAGVAFGPGTEYLRIMQVAGCVAFIGYAMGAPQQSIWWGQSWSRTIRNMLDGLLYGLLTGGTFGWLWPR